MKANQYSQKLKERTDAVGKLKEGISLIDAFVELQSTNLFETKDSLRNFLSRQENKKSTHTGLDEECQTIGIPTEDVGNYWYKGEHFSIHVKNKKGDFWERTEEFIERINEVAPKYDRYVRKPIADPHALVLDPADIHVGKLASATETGDAYNVEIAVQRVREGVNGILHKSEPFNIEKIFFIIGNDILHTDNTKKTTTAGTPQDTDGMWHDNFNIALDMYVEAIETCLVVSDVQVVFNPSNHDYQTGYFLAQTVKAYFRNNVNVTFDVSLSHRKYFFYGSSLIGTTHGDGAKTPDLALLMAHEAKTDWAVCEHKYFYIHHFHHKIAKDYMGVTVESLRSASGTDSWHHQKGYQHSKKAIEGFVHSIKNGRVASLTHYF
jgi:hypothetical protein